MIRENCAKQDRRLMSPSMKIRATTLPLFILLVLGVFALPQRAQPVTPLPDGGYPGGNTAEGQAALLSLTTGGVKKAGGVFLPRKKKKREVKNWICAGKPLGHTPHPKKTPGAAAPLCTTMGAQKTHHAALPLF